MSETDSKAYWLARALFAEEKLERVRRYAVSEQHPFLDKSEPPENEEYNAGKWDVARGVLRILDEVQP